MQDEKLDIAIGASAGSRVWKNKQWTWAKLVSKLKTPIVTNETLKEYAALSKADRSKIKNQGGYVGAYLSGGRRKPRNVVHRQLITVDIDYATEDFLFDFELQFDCEAIIHSTHSHTEKDPRYRLIMPLSREVTADEYNAVARKIAGLIDIDYFDETGFQPYRLMFWPSVSSDAKYVFVHQQGDWLDPDTILDMYADWTDSSLWPTRGDADDLVKDLSKKQQDPEEKAGIVGAFCRTYDIHSAIETFLGEEYEATRDGRYTYLRGSTASGLVTYDDKYAYSHHGTDPISGKLCNAFDLVRVHLYGELDGDSKQEGQKTKSFKAMEQLARKDALVKKTIGQEVVENAKYDFADIGSTDDIPSGEEEVSDEEKADLSWMEDLEIDAKGRYLSTAPNINTLFNNDLNLTRVFRLNEFDRRVYLFKSVPWRRIKEPEPMKNSDFAGIRNYIESIYGIVGAGKIEDAWILEAERNGFHPIRKYLTSLKWDGKKRIADILVKYYKAEDNVYTREAIVKTLVGAVARVMEPGIKFDLVLTLTGKQGTGKSTLPDKLGGEWFSDSFNTLKGNASFEQLQGGWIIEVAELAGLRKAEIETIKHYFSKREDTYRPAYGKSVETNKRQCIFIGTSNRNDFLDDPSGNRRFMPIDCNLDEEENLFIHVPQEEINQYWAEAVELYYMGEELRLSDEARVIAQDEQRKHSKVDDRLGIINAYLDTLLPVDWAEMGVEEREMYMLPDTNKDEGLEERQCVCIAEIWTECLGKSMNDMSKHNTRELNELMRGLPNWQYNKSTKTFPIYGKQRYFKRVEDSKREDAG